MVSRNQKIIKVVNDEIVVTKNPFQQLCILVEYKRADRQKEGSNPHVLCRQCIVEGEFIFVYIINAATIAFFPLHVSMYVCTVSHDDLLTSHNSG